MENQNETGRTSLISERFKMKVLVAAVTDLWYYERSSMIWVSTKTSPFGHYICMHEHYSISIADRCLIEHFNNSYECESCKWWKIEHFTLVVLWHTSKTNRKCEFCKYMIINVFEEDHNTKQTTQNKSVANMHEAEKGHQFSHALHMLYFSYRSIYNTHNIQFWATSSFAELSVL